MPGRINIILASALLFMAGCTASVPEFSSERAFAHLQAQCDFGPRVPGSEAAKKCLEYIHSELKPNADQVVKQPFTHSDKNRGITIQMTNLLASFNATSKKRIFLAAHWDSRPFADRDPVEANRTKPVLGANDGASGVAVLIEIARLLKERPPDIGVDLIFFDGEDYGREGHLEEYFLGSRFFARQAANYRPRFGILLDMVADRNLEIEIEGFSQQHLPHIVDKVWKVAEELEITNFTRRAGAFINDDHKMLIDRGINCIDIIDFNYPDKSNRYWHTLEDTPDKCDPASLGAVGTVLLNVIYREEA